MSHRLRSRTGHEPGKGLDTSHLIGSASDMSTGVRYCLRPADKAPSPLHLTLGSAEPKESPVIKCWMAGCFVTFPTSALERGNDLCGCPRLILPPSEASTSDELEHSFQVRFLNLDIEATCDGDPDIMEVQPVRNTDPRS